MDGRGIQWAFTVRRVRNDVYDKLEQGRQLCLDTQG